MTYMGHQITLTLSDSVYETLRAWAQAQKKSIKQIAIETLQAATLAEDAKQLALINKSDEELWRIAESQLPPSQLRQWRRLIAKHEAGDTLTPAEERALETLLEAGEPLTALKAEAHALLKQRGHSLPQIEQPQERPRRRA